MKEPLTAAERKKQAAKLKKMEAEIHAQVAAYITALELGEIDRFITGIELAKDARAKMGIKLAQVQRWATEGVPSC